MQLSWELLQQTHVVFFGHVLCLPQATDAADKDRALRALARVTTKPLISKTLEYALSPAVRTQDVAVLLVRLAKQGGLGFNMTWQFVIDRADGILEKYGGEQLVGHLGCVGSSCVSAFCCLRACARFSLELGAW